MLSFAQVVDFARAFDAQSGNRATERVYETTCRGAVERFWNFRSWPFHFAEHVIKTYGPFSTGTIAVTNGSATVTHSATGFLHTAWQTPAILTIEGREETYLISSFDSTSQLTLDAAFIGDTDLTATFTIDFCGYTLPSDFVAMCDPIQTRLWPNIKPTTYERWLWNRDDWLNSGGVREYAILRGDGVDEYRIVFMPAPDVQDTFRLIYRRRPPLCVHYGAGTATLTNASTAVTGSGTLWTKSGFTAAGMILELLGVNQTEEYRYLYGTVSTAPSDTSITLTSNWTGPSLSAQVYRLSDRLRFPDSANASLSYLARQQVWELRGDPGQAAYYGNLANQEMLRLANSLTHQESAKDFQALGAYEFEDEGKPLVYPRTVIFTGSP